MQNKAREVLLVYRDGKAAEEALLTPTQLDAALTAENPTKHQVPITLATLAYPLASISVHVFSRRSLNLQSYLHGIR